MGVTPPTVTGGRDGLESGLLKTMGLLGTTIGFIIFALTVIVLSIEVVLNPIYLFAQAKESGVDMGNPISSISWWIAVVITFATTGIQYALLAPGRPRQGLGYKVGWTIAIADTAMDGGGFAAWLNSGSIMTLSGDSTILTLGVFPPLGWSNWPQWAGWLLVCVVCLFHEPFLEKVLSRMHFKPSPTAGITAINIAMWTERAGKLHNKVKLFAISLAPFVMLALDVLLFPQGMQDSTPQMRVFSIFMTFLITAVTVAVWEYYNHLNKEGYPLKDLDRFHQLMFLGALTLTIGDSAVDLMGFNQTIFGSSFPLEADRTLPVFLTAGLVMLMCTAAEPMISDLFSPLATVGLIERDSGTGYQGAGDGNINFGGAGGDSYGSPDPGYGPSPHGGGYGTPDPGYGQPPPGAGGGAHGGRPLDIDD